jgi:hypothetical protein
MSIILETYITYAELSKFFNDDLQVKTLRSLIFTKLQQEATNAGIVLPVDWDRYWTKEEIDGEGFKIICRIPYTISPYNKFTNNLVQGNSYLFISINAVDELIHSFENSISKKMENSEEITERIQGEVSVAIEYLRKLREFFKNCEGELILNNKETTSKL